MQWWRRHSERLSSIAHPPSGDDNRPDGPAWEHSRSARFAPRLLPGQVSEPRTGSSMSENKRWRITMNHNDKLTSIKKHTAAAVGCAALAGSMALFVASGSTQVAAQERSTSPPTVLQAAAASVAQQTTLGIDP